MLRAFRPVTVSACGNRLPAMRRGTGNPGRRADADRRHRAADVADIGRAIAGQYGIVLHLAGLRQRRGFVPEAFTNACSPGELFGGVLDRRKLPQFLIHHHLQRFERERGIVAVDDFPIDTRTRAHCGALRCRFEPWPQRPDFIGLRMAHVIEDLGEIGHDIGRRPATGDDVMDARVHRRMLAHHVDHHVHRLDPVERRTAALGRTRRMRRNAAKAKLARAIGQALARSGRIAIRRMPVDYEICIVEQARTCHIDLARPTLFRGSAI